ncbi:hypothetical protein [Mesorhizobium sp. B2-8-3]|uniref:hypothetical protein n=1 Tax=Mesorhizobium sp. B2-8-3 TaxID=2589905 RepID=UPI001FED6CBD|nr:hypothetical protein [Mesorhizobium sp. B2-8-3]
MASAMRMTARSSASARQSDGSAPPASIGASAMPAAKVMCLNAFIFFSPLCISPPPTSGDNVDRRASNDKIALFAWTMRYRS